MEVVNIKRQEKASLIFHVSTHALAGPLESLQAVICNLYYASSPEKKVSTQRYQKRFFFFLPFYWIYLCRSTHSNFHLNEFHCYSVGHVKCLILSFDIGYYGYSYIFQSNKKTFIVWKIIQKLLLFDGIHLCFWACSSPLTINLDFKRNLKKYYPKELGCKMQMSQVEFLYQAVNFFIMLIIAHDQVTKSWIGRYVCLCKVSHLIDLKFKKNHNCTKVHLTTTTTQANISKMGVLASNAKSFLFSSQILILL